jgi:putative tricarboxylic transport membrane protein
VLNADLIIGFSSIVLAGVVFVATRDLSRLGGLFVNYTLVVIFILSVLMLIKGFVKPQRLSFFDSSEERNNVIVGVVILAVYLILMPLVGFLPASYLFYAIFNLYLAQDGWSWKNILRSVVISAVVVTVFYLVFRFLLAVPLPEGKWFE